MEGYNQPRNTKKGLFSHEGDVEVSGAERLAALARVEEDAKDRYHWNLSLGHEGFFTQRVEVDDVSAYHVADQLFKSHLYTVLGAAWFLKRDIIIWMDSPQERLMLHPEAKRGLTPRLSQDGVIKTRPFTYWTLHGDSFGLGMAMNRFRLLNGEIWEKMGLIYEEGRFPFGKDNTDVTVRYLKIDHKKTLVPPHRFQIMHVVDSAYFLHGTPNQLGMSETICHVFDREEAMEKFPEVFERGLTYDDIADGFARRLADEELDAADQ